MYETVKDSLSWECSLETKGKGERLEGREAPLVADGCRCAVGLRVCRPGPVSLGS